MEQDLSASIEGKGGPPYFLNLEGELVPWDSETITREQIAEEGKWDLAQGVQEVDLRTNETRTLAPGEVVTLQPGKGFSKKLRWQRG